MSGSVIPDYMPEVLRSKCTPRTKGSTVSLKLNSQPRKMVRGRHEHIRSNPTDVVDNLV